MTQRISSRVSIIVATTIFIFGFSIYSCNIESQIHAQSSAFDNKTLFVTGSASTQTKPDKVTMSLGVETTDTKAKAALAANSKLMDKIVNALKIAGIKENETSTIYIHHYSKPRLLHR